MHEFGIGRAANVAIASLPGFTLPGDVSGSDKYYARTSSSRRSWPRRRHHGVRRPGLGVEPVEERNPRRTLREISIKL